MQITGSGYSAGPCLAKSAGTDLAALSHTLDGCWTQYLSSLNAISSASGMNVRNIVDPWGRPYELDENEGESGGCGKDNLASYTQPFNASFINTITVPLSGFSGCAT
jgi:hypothetical protein